ncbi:MAG: FCD domain-containing protein [Actinophytocola sp.]|uniref:FCD domain-containing protein n=1 Tax=Actinophytocola sp. TaxID=1872138 RepID=UPI003D6BFAEA
MARPATTEFLTDLLELRLMVEPGAASLAAEPASAVQHATLEAVYADMAEHAPRLPEDELAFVRADLSRRLWMRHPDEVFRAVVPVSPAWSTCEHIAEWSDAHTRGSATRSSWAWRRSRASPAGLGRVRRSPDHVMAGRVRRLDCAVRKLEAVE